MFVAPVNNFDSVTDTVFKNSDGGVTVAKYEVVIVGADCYVSTFSESWREHLSLGFILNHLQLRFQNYILLFVGKNLFDFPPNN